MIAHRCFRQAREELAYYTQIFNLIALLSSIAYLLFDGTAAWLRVLSACMLTRTFLITACVPVPMVMLYENKYLKDVIC